MANKIYPKPGDLVAYRENDEIQFIIAVATTCSEIDEFGGVVIFSNRDDMSNPIVGSVDDDWWTEDHHFKIMDRSIVNKLANKE